MNYLVDTQVLIWSFFEPEKIRPAVREVFRAQEGHVFYSPISLWEISIKYGLGKLNLSYCRTPESFSHDLEVSPFVYKALERNVIITSHRLPRLHGDPFDRLLIWDAISSGFTLVSEDSRFTQYRRYGLLLL